MIQTLIFQCTILVIVVELSPVNSASEILRPRGVSISRASLYDPSRDFTCLDGSRTIPFKYVNDDYCDCQDGSDEPGTSACPTGFFHCTNAGHRPLNIPSSRVNDGICDCCDTSDEYATSANCENTCTELGRSARAAAQRHAELLKQGNELRLQLSRQGRQLKSDKLVRLEQLKKDQEEAEKIRSEKESLKKAAEDLENNALEKYRKVEEEEMVKQQVDSGKEEEREAFEHFQKLDSDHDGFIRVQDLQAHNMFDKDKNGEVSDDEARYFLSAEELDWSTFYPDGWQRMKPYIMLEKGLFTPPSNIDMPGQNAVDFPPVDAENDDDDDEEEDETGEEEQHLEEAGNVENSDNPEDVGDAEEVKEEPQYDEQTQQLIEEARRARSEFEEADRSVRDVQREIREIEEVVNRDLGAEEEFATLQGQCFEYTDREYTYKMCPFDQVTQTPRSGGADTRLGSWGRWSGNPDKYSTMLFDRGQSCWNGPQRSATVNVFCGLENTLTAASEPNRCEYLFEFTTPAACQSDSQSGRHDEL